MGWGGFWACFSAPFFYEGWGVAWSASRTKGYTGYETDACTACSVILVPFQVLMMRTWLMRLPFALHGAFFL